MAPLHSAAKRGDSELVKVALQHGGVDVNEVDEVRATFNVPRMFLEC
jgi:hypothetical protein